MTVRVGMAGLGYWGPNLARNFASLPGCEVRWLCDASEEALARTGAAHPQARRTGSLDDLLSDPELDAIVLATPVPTHAEMAERVMQAGKHCFVEKPLGRSVAEAERAVAAAEQSGRLLMVGHLLEYHPGVLKLKELADSGELVEVARQVRPPVAEADDGDARHSFQTLGSSRPASPVALRKSTTTFASRTTRAWSIEECAVRIATQS